MPSPAHPLDRFPGHAAWIDGHWKLHRIENKDGSVRFELYDLATDPSEKTDLAADQSKRVAQLKPGLTDWLKSVVGSYNGDDYVKEPAR